MELTTIIRTNKSFEKPSRVRVSNLNGICGSQIPIKAYIYQDEAGEYCAEVPAFSGCISGGATFEEAAANIREAAELWLECTDHLPEGVPANATVECVAL